MPDRCVVPGCVSNCDKTIKAEGYTSCFRFPKDPELYSKWIRSVPWTEWSPTNSSVVCMKHFQENDLSFVEKYVDKDGKTCFRKRDHPVLCDGAIPNVFPNLPSYLSIASGTKQKNPKQKREKIHNHLKKQKEDEERQTDENSV